MAGLPSCCSRSTGLQAAGKLLDRQVGWQGGCRLQRGALQVEAGHNQGLERSSMSRALRRSSMRTGMASCSLCPAHMHT